RRVDAARERERAGTAEVALEVDVRAVGAVQGLVVDPRDRGEQLALALRRPVVQVAPPALVGACLAPAILRGGHVTHYAPRPPVVELPAYALVHNADVHTNPFTFGALALDEAFTDREPELAELAGDLRNGQDVLVYAPRRYGKSSL